MKLEDLDRALKAFRRRLLKNGNWDDGAIELRYDYPDWDWVTFSALIHPRASCHDVIINASWNTKAKGVRLCGWEGKYKDDPTAKYNVI